MAAGAAARDTPTAAGTAPAEGPALLAALAALRPLDGTTYRDEVLARLAECRRIHDVRLAQVAEMADAPALVILAGGTNVGKTTILNALTGAEVATPTPLARGTKAALVYAHRDKMAAFRRGGFLPGYERRDLRALGEPNEEAAAGTLLLSAHERAPWRDLAIADSPDVDSVMGKNRRVAWDLLYAADAVIFVASEEKYNDEACVAFLEKAFRHGKRIFAILNKSGAAEAEADFRSKVVPAAAARAGANPHSARVFVVPYLSGDVKERAAAAEKALAPVAEALRPLAADVARLRAEARRGAAQALREEAAPALARLRREAESLSHHRAEVRRVADAAARGYRASLPSLPIYEFDRVFRMLTEALKVPVIDDVYDRIRAAGAPVGSFLLRLAGVESGASALERALAERDRKDVEAVRVRLGEALSEARRLPDRYPPDMSDALRSALLPSPEAESLFEPGAAFAASLSEAAEAWVDEVLRDLHAKLRGSPNAVAFARGLKALLRVTLAGAAVVAVGHVGLEDLVIAPAVDLLVKLGVEKVVDRTYFARRRDEFYDRRAKVMADLTLERVTRLALGRLEGGVTAERIALVEREMEALLR